MEFSPGSSKERLGKTTKMSVMMVTNLTEISSMFLKKKKSEGTYTLHYSVLGPLPISDCISKPV